MSIAIINDLFSRAVKEISNVAPDKIFIVKDLFSDDEWNSIELSIRRGLGLKFYYNYVKKRGGLLTPIDKTSLKQQTYRKN